MTEQSKLTVLEWRRAKGISQTEMAKNLGVHINTYRAWESSPSKIKMSDAIKFAKLIGVDLESISFLP